MNDERNDEHRLSRLLAVLADGEVHSGRELGELLGVSRAAVWKQLQKLETYGLALESVKGRGYRLPGGLELLEHNRVTAELTELSGELLGELALFAVTDSTNARTMARAAPGAGGYVCLAEQQTAGRGRRGRTWVSPFGRNLYLSVLWEFDTGAAALEGLSLATGVALVRALEACGVPDLQLKWPNDLLWQNRKLAGILLEMTGDPAGQCQVVIGIGVNGQMPGAAAAEIDQPWVDLSEITDGRPPSRNRLAAAILNELLPLLDEYQRSGFAPWRENWQALDALASREVVLSSASRQIHGRVLGVTDTGALRLECDGGEEIFYGGELSLRAVS